MIEYLDVVSFPIFECQRQFTMAAWLAVGPVGTIRPGADKSVSVRIKETTPTARGLALATWRAFGARSMCLPCIERASIRVGQR